MSRSDEKKLVPIQPTIEMIAAGWDALNKGRKYKIGPGPGLVEVFKAMALAAPKE